LRPKFQSFQKNVRLLKQVSASAGSTYFLVDPLDGTREFVAGRDEFTVNIALIDAGAPILGIVTAPAVDVTWRGIVGGGAELTGKGTRTAIRTRRRPAHPVVMISRSHLDTDTKAYLANLAGGQRASYRRAKPLYPQTFSFWSYALGRT
jgi:3'-phosphoadenosine 5'-phosphosulfate (PAPS) 3'-phosphatase